VGVAASFSVSRGAGPPRERDGNAARRIGALDDAGNIEAIDDGVISSLDQTFGYDELHRLDAESGAYGSESHSTTTRGIAKAALTARRHRR
jgi:hypothetical protein